MDIYNISPKRLINVFLCLDEYNTINANFLIINGESKLS